MIVVGRYVTKKSGLRETLNVSALADSSTDAKRLKIVFKKPVEIVFKKMLKTVKNN